MSETQFYLNRSMLWGNKSLLPLCFNPLKNKQVASVTTVFLFSAIVYYFAISEQIPLALLCQIDSTEHFIFYRSAKHISKMGMWSCPILSAISSTKTVLAQP